MDRNNNNGADGQYVVDYRFYQYPRGVNRGGYCKARYAQQSVVLLGNITAYWYAYTKKNSA